MRVLHLLGSADMGGAERVMASICRLQVERGHEVWACMPESSLIEPQIVDAGVKLLMPPLKTPLCLPRLAMRVRKMGIDILHAHLTSGVHAANVIGLFADAAVVVHGHICSTDYNYRWAVRRGEMVAVSEALARHYVARLGVSPDRITVVANGSDVDLMPSADLEPDAARAALCHELGVAQSSRFLLVAGRLVPIKGQDVLLEAFEGLHRDHPDLHLVLAGPPEDPVFVRRLRRFVEERGIRGNVHFLGLRSDVARLLRAAAVAAVPSRIDAFALAVIEPLLLGVPVVASNVGGIPEIVVAEGAPCLVPPNDPGALASAVARILASPEEAYARASAARRPALDRYSVGAMVDGIEAVYAKVAPIRIVESIRV